MEVSTSFISASVCVCLSLWGGDVQILSIAHLIQGINLCLFGRIDRGSFSICNENFDSVNGLAAHLSSKACLKVCQQASLLPALLCPTMLPKFDAWPKSFQISQPSDDNIALYFFPENERCQFQQFTPFSDLVSPFGSF